MECLNRNDYDREKCLDFFQAYRDCKKAWVRPTFSPRTRLHVTNANRFLRLSNARQTAELGNIDNTSFYPTRIHKNGITIIAHYLTACFLSPLSACLAPKSQDRIHVVRERHQRHA
jgi:hypothetical protein